VEFLGKATCISHSQKTLPTHYSVNLANRLTVLHYIINYDLFFPVLWLASMCEAVVKKGRNGQLAGIGKDKNIYFFASYDFLKMFSGCVQPI